MAVSKRLRYEILRRDNHTCRYCGATAPDVKLTVDHVTPTALGGTDTPDNLVTACEPCNSGKTSTPADSAIVADVAQDALRWASAIKQAAAELEAQVKPKADYQATFKAAWDSWTFTTNQGEKTLDLDPAWRTSLERFRQAGLPSTVWPDIVETAMTAKTVRADNVFRYCCGIAWRKVAELQDRAKEILGVAVAAPTGEDEERDVIVDAAVSVWVNEWADDISNEQGNAFTASVRKLREDGGEDEHRILQGAQFAAWFHQTDIEKALEHLDRDSVRQSWTTAWFAAAFEYPSKELDERFDSQVDTLLKAGVDVSRVLRAALYAGAHRSAHLYFGLGEAELALTERHVPLIRASEIWAKAFLASADRWPTFEERAAFHASTFRVGDDGGYLVRDLYVAAAAAGAYQDSDVSACLTRHGSVFEAAAQPLQGGAA